MKNDSNSSSKNSSGGKQKTLVKRRSKVVSSPDDDRSDSSKENTPPVSALLTHDNLILHARGEKSGNNGNGNNNINGVKPGKTKNDNDIDKNANKRASHTESVDLCVYESVAVTGSADDVISGAESSAGVVVNLNRPGVPPRPKEDDETSVYSTDTDGFYTSMRADCGLKRRSYHGGSSPASPDRTGFFSGLDFYGGGGGFGGEAGGLGGELGLRGASKEEPTIGTNGMATIPGIPGLAASSSTPQSLRSSKR